MQDAGGGGGGRGAVAGVLYLVYNVSLEYKSSTRATASGVMNVGEITSCDKCSAVRIRVSAWRLYSPRRITS